MKPGTHAGQLVKFPRHSSYKDVEKLNGVFPQIVRIGSGVTENIFCQALQEGALGTQDHPGRVGCRHGGIDITQILMRVRFQLAGRKIYMGISISYTVQCVWGNAVL